jgi:DNA-binding NarL/FixJ family response regulator
MSTKKKVRLIVADDHPVYREGISVLLPQEKFSVTHACNGEDVIKLLKTKSYDIVLMDIRMSPINGFEATEIISKDFPKVKVIVLSMFDEDSYIIEMFNKGAKGYLMKTSGIHDILEAISTVLENKFYYPKKIPEHLSVKLKNLYTASSAENTHSNTHDEKLKEIIYLLCKELTSKEIASALNLSVRTIEEYRSEIMIQTQSKNIAGVFRYALKNGILDDEILQARLNRFIENKN